MQTLAKIAEGAQTSWVIDPTHTTVEFVIRNWFFFTVKGTLAVSEGTIALDAADLGNSSVTASLKSSSIDTRSKSRDGHLRGRDFLQSDVYPLIRFQSTRVEPGSDRDTLRVTGSLTIRDKTREILLDICDIDRSCSPSGEQVAYYTALAELDRHDFGIDYMRGVIGRKLLITINVQATQRMGSE
jgi:polyisoprenoid-binding protein YceI